MDHVSNYGSQFSFRSACSLFSFCCSIFLSCYCIFTTDPTNNVRGPLEREALNFEFDFIHFWSVTLVNTIKTTSSNNKKTKSTYKIIFRQ
jgi:hypothetical protein